MNDTEKTRKSIIEYGLSFPDTYADAPFHDDNRQLVRFRENNKAFLWTYEKDGFINLKFPVSALSMQKASLRANLLSEDRVHRQSCLSPKAWK